MQASGGSGLTWSEACERNKQPILQVLRAHLPETGAVLEIGSGTGQHIVYFASELCAGLQWQPADTGDFLAGLRARLAIEAPQNVRAAIDLDVRMTPWPLPDRYDAVFSANTLHFMSAACVEQFFRGVAEVSRPASVLVVYGPFRYNHTYTSDSNARFDQQLKVGDPTRGIKDFEWVNQLAAGGGFELVADIGMPANNQALVWRRA